ARRLKRMLNDMGIEVQTMLHSVEESIQWFLDHEHPDLILLDIQLSDGLSFEIFKEVNIESNIIFTTAYDEYALKAFKLNSIDYLLKPIDDDELHNAIEKYRKYSIKENNTQFDIEQIKKLLVNPLEKNYKKRFTIKVGQHLKIVNTKSIECFYSENKATFLHTNKGKNYILDETLEQIEEQLDSTKYFRVSRKFIINMDFIKDIISYTNSRLQVKLEHFNEFDIIVSREKVKDFKTWLE
ncbi:MAG: DNA-binding response regulator, partial [Bacteroidetes bacterium]